MPVPKEKKRNVSDIPITKENHILNLLFHVFKSARRFLKYFCKKIIFLIIKNRNKSSQPLIVYPTKRKETLERFLINKHIRTLPLRPRLPLFLIITVLKEETVPKEIRIYKASKKKKKPKNHKIKKKMEQNEKYTNLPALSQRCLYKKNFL